MNTRNTDNKKLDAIGKRLIGNAGLSPNEIEQIVSNPRLFEMVNKRIAANTDVPVDNPAFPFFRRNAAALSGVAVILIAVAAAASLLSPERPVFTALESQVPETVPEVARPALPPQGKVTTLAAGRALDREGGVQKAAAKPVSKKADKKRPSRAVPEPEGDFYALSFAGHPDETDGGGRIIRVDMPRSTLFALGVNIPLENGPDAVKADLLIGSDGLTRGIRLVN